MEIRSTLDSFFTHTAPTDAGDVLLVAFSGGPDSTCLLEHLAALAPNRDWRIVAAHLDHGTDPASTDRARRAAAVARDLEVGWVSAARDVPGERRAGESLEAAGRRLRYVFLEATRTDVGARWIVTAQHADDQAETLVLRILQGSGLEGLRGIRPVRGRVVRPLLSVSRARLAAARVRDAASDPANRDPSFARSAVRHRLLPRLEAARPGIAADLARLAERAGGARRRIHAVLETAAPLTDTADGPALALRHFRALPPVLRPWALARLHQLAGAAHPPGIEARRELDRQLDGWAGENSHIGCDAGDGWRWESRGPALTLRRATADVTPIPGFTYTLSVPGEVAVPELSLRVRLAAAPIAPWMYRGAPHRAGLRLPAGTASRATVRTRRPGDRLRPLGAGGTRRLKDVLIDHKVPAAHRERLPLLVIDDRIAWVPGVIVDDRFRLPPSLGEASGETAWVAEILPLGTIGAMEPTESSPRGCG